jgi:hypothetical protein
MPSTIQRIRGERRRAAPHALTSPLPPVLHAMKNWDMPGGLGLGYRGPRCILKSPVIWPEISRCGRGLADEQADRVGSARRVLVCRLWIARPAISASGRWVLKHLPSEVRFGPFRALFTIARYLSTGRSKLWPLKVISCGRSCPILSTKALMSSASDRSPMCGAPSASIRQPSAAANWRSFMPIT